MMTQSILKLICHERGFTEEILCAHKEYRQINFKTTTSMIINATTCYNKMTMH